MNEDESDVQFRVALEAGVAIFNSGEYHDAHDAWEDVWLTLESGRPKEQLLHGLIQYSAAVHHAVRHNHVGATGLSQSARTYLSSLPSTYGGISLSPIHHILAAIALDPMVVHRHEIPAMLVNGKAIQPQDLTADGLYVAALVIAHDEEHIATAIIDEAAQFQTQKLIRQLLIDLITYPERRPTILARLEAHLDRESAKHDDVTGLFEPE